MFSRATSMPVSTSSRICSSEETAGPRVQTIFALRTGRPYCPRDVPRSALVNPDGPGSGVGRRSDDQRPGGRRDRRGQGGRAGQVLVDGRRGGPSLGDRPDDQRLAATGVAGHEDTRRPTRRTPRRGRRCRARPGRRRAARRARSCSRAGEAHREAAPARPGSRARCPRPAGTVASTSTRRSARTLPSSSPRNSLVDTAYTRSPASSCAEETRKVIGYVGHGWSAGPRLRRVRHDLELGDRRRALAGGRAEAVRAGVAAADDHHVLAGGGDLVRSTLLAERRPGWPAAGTPSPGGCRRARGRGPAGHAAAWRRWRAPPRRTARAAGRRSASPPTSTPARKTVPSRRIWSRRRSRCCFSILNSGMP